MHVAERKEKEQKEKDERERRRRELKEKEGKVDAFEWVDDLVSKAEELGCYETTEKLCNHVSLILEGSAGKYKGYSRYTKQNCPEGSERADERFMLLQLKKHLLKKCVGERWNLEEEEILCPEYWAIEEDYGEIEG